MSEAPDLTTHLGPLPPEMTAETSESGQWLRALVLVPARKLELFRRVPELATKRGWHGDGDKGHAMLILAIGAVFLSVGGTRIRLSTFQQLQWPRLPEHTTASQVVEVLDLYELLELP